MNNFEEYAERLTELVADWRGHHDTTGCDLPLCTGETMKALTAAAYTDVGWAVTMLLAAVAMLADHQKRDEELGRLLEVQRGLTADAAAQAMHLDADLVDAHGQIAGLELRVSGLLAELTAWEEAADVIGPVLPVAEV